MKQMILCALGLLLMAQTTKGQVTVQVNCTQWVDYPLVKKIGVYQTPLMNKTWIDRDVPKLGELEVRSMRYEMACGKDDLYGQPCVGGNGIKTNVQLFRHRLFFEVN